MEVTFPVILLIAVACFVVAWGAAELAWRSFWPSSTGKGAVSKLIVGGPMKAWLGILTRFPCLVMLIGSVAPVFLSFLAVKDAGYRVPLNMDFETYLLADMPSQHTETAVDTSRTWQRYKLGNRRRTGWTTRRRYKYGKPSPAPAARRLQSVPRQAQFRGWNLDMFYQSKTPNLDGGVFRSGELHDIRDFEKGIFNFNLYTERCRMYADNEICKLPSTTVNYFFPSYTASGAVVEDGQGSLTNIDSVLTAFAQQEVQWWTDRYFSATNKTSDYTRSTFQGGYPLLGYVDYSDRTDTQKGKQKEWLWDLYLNHLLATETDDSSTIIVSWYEPDLFTKEVMRWLTFDCLWATGSFAVMVTLMLFQLRSIWLTMAGVFGIMISFTQTLYFHIVVMKYASLTIMDCVCLFLIMGIGADDVFVMYNTFHLASAVLGADATPQAKMKWAYGQAGAAMLMTTVTTVVSFYSNLFNVIVIIKQFGFYMGTLVALNYMNVMIIFPAALMIYELYLAKCKCYCSCCCCRRRRSDKKGDPQFEERGAPSRSSIASRGAFADGGEQSFSSTLSSASKPAARVGKSLVSMGVSQGTLDNIRNSTATAARRTTIGIRNTQVALKAADKMRKSMMSRTSLAAKVKQELDESSLSAVERFMYRNAAPLLNRARVMFVSFGIFFACVGLLLIATSFKTQSGTLQIFPHSVNAGRVDALRKSVFPTSNSDDRAASEAAMSTGRSTGSSSGGGGGSCNPSVSSCGRQVKTPLTGSCPTTSNGVCDLHGTCDSSYRCRCDEGWLEPTCNVQKKPANASLAVQQDPVTMSYKLPPGQDTGDDKNVTKNTKVIVKNGGDSSYSWTMAFPAFVSTYSILAHCRGDVSCTFSNNVLSGTSPPAKLSKFGSNRTPSEVEVQLKWGVRDVRAGSNSGIVTWSPESPTTGRSTWNLDLAVLATPSLTSLVAKLFDENGMLLPQGSEIPADLELMHVSSNGKDTVSIPVQAFSAQLEYTGAEGTTARCVWDRCCSAPCAIDPGTSITERINADLGNERFVYRWTLSRPSVGPLATPTVHQEYKDFNDNTLNVVFLPPVSRHPAIPVTSYTFTLSDTCSISVPVGHATDLRCAVPCYDVNTDSVGGSTCCTWIKKFADPSCVPTDTIEVLTGVATDAIGNSLPSASLGPLHLTSSQASLSSNPAVSPHVGYFEVTYSGSFHSGGVMPLVRVDCTATSTSGSGSSSTAIASQGQWTSPTLMFTGYITDLNPATSYTVSCTLVSSKPFSMQGIRRLQDSGSALQPNLQPPPPPTIRKVRTYAENAAVRVELRNMESVLCKSCHLVPSCIAQGPTSLQADGKPSSDGRDLHVDLSPIVDGEATYFMNCFVTLVDPAPAAIPGLSDTLLQGAASQPTAGVPVRPPAPRVGTVQGSGSYFMVPWFLDSRHPWDASVSQYTIQCWLTISGRDDEQRTFPVTSNAYSDAGYAYDYSRVSNEEANAVCAYEVGEFTHTDGIIYQLASRKPDNLELVAPAISSVRPTGVGQLTVSFTLSASESSSFVRCTADASGSGTQFATTTGTQDKLDLTGLTAGQAYSPRCERFIAEKVSNPSVFSGSITALAAPSAPRIANASVDQDNVLRVVADIAGISVGEAAGYDTGPLDTYCELLRMPDRAPVAAGQGLQNVGGNGISIPMSVQGSDGSGPAVLVSCMVRNIVADSQRTESDILQLGHLISCRLYMDLKSFSLQELHQWALDDINKHLESANPPIPRVSSYNVKVFRIANRRLQESAAFTRRLASETFQVSVGAWDSSRRSGYETAVDNLGDVPGRTGSLNAKPGLAPPNVQTVITAASQSPQHRDVGYATFEVLDGAVVHAVISNDQTVYVSADRFTIRAQARQHGASAQVVGSTVAAAVSPSIFLSEEFSVPTNFSQVLEVIVHVVSMGLIEKGDHSVKVMRRSVPCTSGCGDNGECNLADGTCQCSGNYTPDTTTGACTAYCPNGCGLNGACQEVTAQAVDANMINFTQTCKCNATYTGAQCSDRECLLCMNNGTCGGYDNDWQCQCPAPYNGSRCEEHLCPNNCGVSGTCDTTTGVCNCYPGYSGVDCSLRDADKVPVTSAIQVTLAWGIKTYSSQNNSEPAFFAGFDFYDPQVHLWIYEACKKARQATHLQVREEQKCWIEEFADFVNYSGGTFPMTNRTQASNAIQAFFTQQAVQGLYEADVYTDGAFFDGSILSTTARLLINYENTLGGDAVSKVRKDWEGFLSLEINRGQPKNAGDALVVSSTFTQGAVEQEILSSTVGAFFLSIGLVAVATAGFTGNIVLALYVCLNILLVVFMLFGFMLGVLRYKFGAIEAIGATIFVGMSVDYCLHLAHGYHEAHERDAYSKVRLAMVHLGPSIIGGATSTITATLFLLPCRILIFVQLGTMMLCNSFLSVCYTFLFLCPLLMLVGPEGTTGDLYQLVHCRCFSSKKAHLVKKDNDHQGLLADRGGSYMDTYGQTDDWRGVATPGGEHKFQPVVHGSAVLASGNPGAAEPPEKQVKCDVSLLVLGKQAEGAGSEEADTPPRASSKRRKRSMQAIPGPPQWQSRAAQRGRDSEDVVLRPNETDKSGGSAETLDTSESKDSRGSGSTNQSEDVAARRIKKSRSRRRGRPPPSVIMETLLATSSGDNPIQVCRTSQLYVASSTE